jgi:hypothetical protein
VAKLRQGDIQIGSEIHKQTVTNKNTRNKNGHQSERHTDRQRDIQTSTETYRQAGTEKNPRQRDMQTGIETYPRQKETQTVREPSRQSERRPERDIYRQAEIHAVQRGIDNLKKD